MLLSQKIYRGGEAVSNCDNYVEQISMYVDGFLAEDEQAQLMAHIETCPLCRDRLTAFTAMHGGIEEQEVPFQLHEAIMLSLAQANNDKKVLDLRKRFKAIKRVSVAAACAVIAVSIWRVSAPPTTPTQPSVVSLDGVGTYSLTDDQSRTAYVALPCVMAEGDIKLAKQLFAQYDISEEYDSSITFSLPMSDYASIDKITEFLEQNGFSVLLSEQPEQENEYYLVTIQTGN